MYFFKKIPGNMYQPERFLKIKINFIEFDFPVGDCINSKLWVFQAIPFLISSTKPSSS